jgi:DNA-binding NtrC family response regulator
MSKPAILLTGGEPDCRAELIPRLLGGGFDVIEWVVTERPPSSCEERCPDLAIVFAPRHHPRRGVEVAGEIRRQAGELPIILITPTSSEELAIAALKAGISDYFKHPVSVDELLASVELRVSDRRGRPKSVPDKDKAFARPNGPCRMIGDSREVRETRAYIDRVAATDSTVLITGDTGTGKELVAQLIHMGSRRCQRQFVSINCAAVPDNLLEAELFGHERGAFTGAHAFNQGRLKLADRGTAFFDEIGDMSVIAQAKILRVIESKEIHRLGARAGVPLDIRVIAATNQDLNRLMVVGTFRKDLYFRLSVTRIHLEPLKDHKEDIPALIDHYVRHFNRKFGRELKGFTDESVAQLLTYDWPGNVRELKNLVEAAYVDLPLGPARSLDLPKPFRGRLRDSVGLPAAERDRLLSALFATNWNKSKAAQQLRWSRMTLYRKLARHHIKPCSRGRAPGGRSPSES